MLWGAGCVSCACPVLTGGWGGDSPPYRTKLPELERLRLEDSSTVADLLSTSLIALQGMAHVVCAQALFLCVRVDLEQEDAVEKIKDTINVQRDAADEYGPRLLGRQLLEPCSIPNPMVCSEPLFVRRTWAFVP